LSGLRIATFHEYCNDLLRENGRQFDVVDDQDLWIYLRRRLRELNLKYFVRAASVSKFLEDLLKFMRHCHDELVSRRNTRNTCSASNVGSCRFLA